jgi:Uncharacterized alpha/beta hydrolase domain (DUF2235)
MPKNILIFSDGTGQAGGIKFDEDRTNIYKLYRATRCGPDSCIHPDEQVSFYDPGLGSPADRGFMFGKAGHWMYNIASQATGLGLTANIIDCYAALIRLYRDGDRILLFGFSRGAYTMRCLAAVIAKCGIPRHMPDGKRLPLSVAGSRKLATYAVKNVYQFCSSKPRTKPDSYRNFMLDTRELIAERFRKEHGSSNVEQPTKANVYPYFIGVFDTVAALGRTGAVVGLAFALAIVVAAISWITSFLSVSAFSEVELLGGLLKYLTFAHVFIFPAGAIVVGGLIAILQNYVKYDFRVPGYGFLKSLATIHLAERKQKFTDYSLNVNVEYAKHAISIDENRRDFKRVPWDPDETKAGIRDGFGNIYFEQVWFSGVHADIGGGYPENESRLSDITLKWMLAAASMIPNGIKHDDTVLRVYPDPTGPQHDECKAGHWEHGVRDLPADENTKISDATMHKSVYARFEVNEVVQYDMIAPYRPANLQNHVDFTHYYNQSTPTSTGDPKAIADDIELKWKRQKSGQSG